jgi:transcriptional regulator with XRE-family HTH domain
MPNVNAVINEQIRRLARREVRTSSVIVKRATSQYRHAIALLKKQVAALTRRLGQIEKRGPGAAISESTGGGGGGGAVIEGARFRAMGVKAHRAKLGLSAADYAKLVGVSPLTIYHWEHGKARPRNKETLGKWLAIRGLGKREALERLGISDGGGNGKTDGRRRRGKFKQTGQETILSLLKDRKSLTTSAINEAWRREGRGGTADVMLGLLVKSKRLKRTKIQGKRGSEYRLA